MKFKNIAQGLTIVSFIAVCWVGSRALRYRGHCLNSSFIGFVQIGATRVDNCAYESRLSLRDFRDPLTPEEMAITRQLEVLEPLNEVFTQEKPMIAVQIFLQEPRLFEIDRGLIRLGVDWLKDRTQTKRALIMGVLKREKPEKFANAFELETITDFLMLTSMNEPDGAQSFSTSLPAFADYCKSPLRSLAHYATCATSDPDTDDLEARVWGFRPVLATALNHVFAKLNLSQKLKMLSAIATGHVVAAPEALRDASLLGMSKWFEDVLREHLRDFGLQANADTDLAVRRTLKELEVEAPTHWELTVDITATPAWREILEQLKTYSRLRRNERTLVFTPEGQVALPSGLPVAWGKDQIASQTHVLIACQWPKPDEAVSVQARHMFARQTCGKVDQVFWN